MGLRPLLVPFCTSPPRSGVCTPLGVFNSRWVCEGMRLLLRELPSLAALAQAISLRNA